MLPFCLFLGQVSSWILDLILDLGVFLVYQSTCFLVYHTISAQVIVY
jgi:hypothetical protein